MLCPEPDFSTRNKEKIGMSLKQARPSGSGPLPTEEYIRRVFAEARRGRERDHTPRSVRPNGSMNTEDWLREVVFGTERSPRPEPAAASPLRQSPRPEASEASPPAPFGRGTILFPGKLAASAGPLLAETAGGARRDVGGVSAFPTTIMTAAAPRRGAPRAAPPQAAPKPATVADVFMQSVRGGDAALTRLNEAAQNQGLSREERGRAAVGAAVAPALRRFAGRKPELRDFADLADEIQERLDALPALSPEEKNAHWGVLREKAQPLYQDSNYAALKAKQPLYARKRDQLGVLFERADLSEEEIIRITDDFMEKTYKTAYGDKAPGDADWKTRVVPDRRYYPERSRILGQGAVARAERLLKTEEGTRRLKLELERVDPPVDVAAWGQNLPGDRATSRNGLPPELIATVKTYTDKYNVPLMLALGVLSKESDGKPGDTSGRGAVGYMQVRSDEFTEVKKYYPHCKAYALSQPEQNIEIGVLGLKRRLEQYDGDWISAMISYNCGIEKFNKTFNPLLQDQNIRTQLSNGEVPKEFANLTKLKEACEYVPKTFSIISRHQPGFIMPQNSFWSHLPPEAKIRYRRKPGGQNP